MLKCRSGPSPDLPDLPAPPVGAGFFSGFAHKSPAAPSPGRESLGSKR